MILVCTTHWEMFGSGRVRAARRTRVFREAARSTTIGSTRVVRFAAKAVLRMHSTARVFAFPGLNNPLLFPLGFQLRLEEASGANARNCIGRCESISRTIGNDRLSVLC